jgi:hypothetical protein
MINQPQGGRYSNSSYTSTAPSWNGPICGKCGVGYLEFHKCSREDILRRVAELLELLGCPGILSGIKITC